MKATINTENDVVNKFIIDVTLIDPINKIIDGLKNGKYRNIDINYLDKKLEHFTEVACKMLNIDFSGTVIENDRSGVILNDYTKNIYIERFTTLLRYFEGINK
ncbi:MAG TPA: hypothetical protein PLN36_05365 [Bacteroidales bacterium]|nr:hypothetical protein [Bacteroidales bacterium]